MAASLFLSVVIPTYNRREMLRECLETLEAQTYPRDLFEVIVVNDGSQDGTDSFLEAYQKKQDISCATTTKETGAYLLRGTLALQTPQGCRRLHRRRLHGRKRPPPNALRRLYR